MSRLKWRSTTSSLFQNIHPRLTETPFLLNINYFWGPEWTFIVTPTKQTDWLNRDRSQVRFSKPLSHWNLNIAVIYTVFKNQTNELQMSGSVFYPLSTEPVGVFDKRGTEERLSTGAESGRRSDRQNWGRERRRGSWDCWIFQEGRAAALCGCSSLVRHLKNQEDVGA